MPRAVWRLLEPGEVVQEGDEYLPNNDNSEWLPAYSGLKLRDFHRPHRRAIELPTNHPPGETTKAVGAECLGASTAPLFEQRANATLNKVTATFGQRGNEYGDTWRNCQFTVMKAIVREFRLDVPNWALRALATAAFVDMKYQRNEGGYKEDSLIDGIAYLAFLADEMRAIKEGKK